MTPLELKVLSTVRDNINGSPFTLNSELADILRREGIEEDKIGSIKDSFYYKIEAYQNNIASARQWIDAILTQNK